MTSAERQASHASTGIRFAGAALLGYWPCSASALMENKRMLVVWVDIQVKPEHVDAFIAASEDNHRHTLCEPGNRRFDVLRLNDQPTHFRLYEVYVDEEAFRAHQQTAHYFRWKEAVEPFMAVRRSAEKLTALFPQPWQ